MSNRKMDKIKKSAFVGKEVIGIKINEEKEIADTEEYDYKRLKKDIRFLRICFSIQCILLVILAFDYGKIVYLLGLISNSMEIICQNIETITDNTYFFIENLNEIVLILQQLTSFFRSFPIIFYQ